MLDSATLHQHTGDPPTSASASEKRADRLSNVCNAVWATHIKPKATNVILGPALNAVAALDIENQDRAGGCCRGTADPDACIRSL